MNGALFVIYGCRKLCIYLQISSWIYRYAHKILQVMSPERAFLGTSPNLWHSGLRKVISNLGWIILPARQGALGSFRFLNEYPTFNNQFWKALIARPYLRADLGYTKSKEHSDRQKINHRISTRSWKMHQDLFVNPYGWVFDYISVIFIVHCPRSFLAPKPSIDNSSQLSQPDRNFP